MTNRKEDVKIWKDILPFSSLQGWIYKQDTTPVFSSWRKRYFVQEGDKLYWYKSSNHLEHIGVANLMEVVSVDQRDTGVKTGSELWKFEIRFKTKSFYLRCETEEEMNYWITGLKNCVSFFQEDWSTTLGDEEDNSPTDTEYHLGNRGSPRSRHLKVTQSKRGKSHSNPTQTTNSKFGGFTTTPPPTLITEEQNNYMNSSPQPNPQHHILQIPPLTLRKNENLSLRWKEFPLRPSSPKPPHLIRFSSTGLIICSPSISETPKNEKIIPSKLEFPEEKIKRLEELTERQGKTINSLLGIIQKGKDEQKKLEKEVSEFESKKKGLHLLLETKDGQIRKERQLRFEAENEKTRELEEALNGKNEQISKLEKRVKEMELELLEKKEQEDKRIQLVSKEKISKQLEIDQKQKDLEAELLKVKRKYFFTLALNIKISKSLFDMDINALYTRVTEQKIPVDQWDSWILQHAHNKDAWF